jgi:dipeptidyl aminopeptidase/acylaminoacyl peptidase
MLDLKRLARLASFALLVLLALFILSDMVFAWQYSHALLHVGCQGERIGLDESVYPSEAIEFRSREGYLLRGWYSQGQTYPQIAIIVLPGLSSNTVGAVPDAEMLARAGFSTLMFEHRSCADPDLLFSAGYFEAQDVIGAVDYLRSRGDVSQIGALGLSAGGTAVILAAAQEPAIEAVVAMGGFTSLQDDILDSDDRLNLYSRLTRYLVQWHIHRQLGVHPRDINPAREIGKISPRPVFLIYGEYERIGPDMLEAANDPKELWVVPGTGHAGYRGSAPDEYERRIVDFFRSAFDAPPPDAP